MSVLHIIRGSEHCIGAGLERSLSSMYVMPFYFFSMYAPGVISKSMVNDKKEMVKNDRQLFPICWAGDHADRFLEDSMPDPPLEMCSGSKDTPVNTAGNSPSAM